MQEPPVPPPPQRHEEPGRVAHWAGVRAGGPARGARAGEERVHDAVQRGRTVRGGERAGRR